jgi:outer membrane receptor protein involved in Fe transport
VAKLKSMFLRKSIFLLFWSILGQNLLAQTGQISGKIMDTKFAEAVIGATIRLDDGSKGCVTDFDGAFLMNNVPVGKHKITISYLGYATKEIQDIDVKNDENKTLSLTLEEPKASEIVEVVIIATAKKESMSAMTMLQKNAATIGDGISAESIKRTPDRTTGDVLKRISGASIQDNRFVIIRGLSDRYNIAMLNGALLSSTEPDRKAFSFDLIPSNMLDNLVVVKTASPDLPGEFAGGAILLTTRDVPESKFFQIGINGGYHGLTTGKKVQIEQGGSRDWLGMDDGSRALPRIFPTTKEAFFKSNEAEKMVFSQSFKNNWATHESTVSPNLGGQISGGFSKKLNDEATFGLLAALTYSRNNRLSPTERNDFDSDGALYFYNDQNFKTNVLWGGLVNSSMQFNRKNKLGLQLGYTVNSDQTTIHRTGKEFNSENFVDAISTEFIENQLVTSRLSGEHVIGERGAKIEWGGGVNHTFRETPDARRMFFSKSFDAVEGQKFSANVPFGGANRSAGGRFFSKMDENILNGNTAISLPFFIAAQKQVFKIGGLVQQKNRTFDARVLGMKVNRVIGFDFNKLTLPIDQIFANENLSTNGFVLDEITNKADNYDANSRLSAAFLMFDNKILNKFRLAWGLRTEQFTQKLNSFDYTNQPVNLSKTYLDVLPSANFTWLANDKTNVRLSASKTVGRPEFRELAPFSFYDFYTSSSIAGNPNLARTQISNFDVRYEIFPGLNQLASVSGFFKHFKNPIEQIVSSSGAGTRLRTFQNVPSATAFGAEMELRKNFAFLAPTIGNWAENLVFFTNLAIIRSKVDFGNNLVPNPNRPMQGQSPYVLNAGLQWNQLEKGWNVTVVFNRIGDRVHEVGFDGFADIFEKHRNVLDFQLAKRLGKSSEIKISCADLLAAPMIFYQDNNANRKQDGGDNLIQRARTSASVSISASFKF